MPKAIYNAKAAAAATAATASTDRDAMLAAPLHVLIELALISVTAVFPASTCANVCNPAELGCNIWVNWGQAGC